MMGPVLKEATEGLTGRPDSWVGWHCMVAPRVLIWGAPGIGLEIVDRVYTPEEVAEVAGLRIAAEVETVEGWVGYVRWVDLNLYPEWERRRGRAHKNAPRVAWIRRNILPHHFIEEGGRVC